YRALSSINGKSFIASSLVNRIAMIDSLVSLKLVVIRFCYASIRIHSVITGGVVYEEKKV
ncbi:hypothetical protein ACXHPT_07940, partial [Vibrio cincinnatiensis]